MTQVGYINLTPIGFHKRLLLRQKAEVFCGGDLLVEEIITALSRIRWLFVAARNSRFTYKGQTVDVKQSARIGSAKRRGNRAERGGHHQAAWC